VIAILKEIFTITKIKYQNCFYDDACHLHESVKAHVDEHHILKDMNFYIDRFHLKNHKRKVSLV